MKLLFALGVSLAVGLGVSWASLWMWLFLDKHWPFLPCFLSAVLPPIFVIVYVAQYWPEPK